MSADKPFKIVKVGPGIWGCGVALELFDECQTLQEAQSRITEKEGKLPPYLTLVIGVVVEGDFSSFSLGKCQTGREVLPQHIKVDGVDLYHVWDYRGSGLADMYVEIDPDTPIKGWRIGAIN